MTARPCSFAALALLALQGCADPTHASEEPRPSILLVTLDTVRADRLGCYGYGGARTPALDALADRGVRFAEAYTPAPMTLPAHATMMTGLLPPQHGARVNGLHRLEDDVPTLAETLAQAGYRTGAFIAAFVLDSRFGLDRGFEHYDDDLTRALEQEVPSPLARHRSGDEVVDAALRWLSEPDARPFFAWVHLYDAHYPWRSQEPAARGASVSSGAYDEEVAFVDAQVGRLTTWLAERGFGKSTLVIAVADHGEGLGDHHEIEHGYLLNEEVLHVPWIVAGPGVAAGHEVGALVALDDLMPTVLDLVGLEQTRARGGRSLVAALRGGAVESRASYAETDLPWTSYRWAPQKSLTTADWKLVQTPEAELYDRFADRAELVNLIEVRPEVRDKLAAELAAIEHGLGDRRGQVAAVTSAERELLGMLGYTAGADEEPAGSAAAADVKARLRTKDRACELARRRAMNAVDLSEVIAIARELVRESPETPSFHFTLGSALVEAGDVEAGIEILAHGVELEPTSAGGHYDLGDALQRVGRHAAATPHFELALELEPGMAAAHVGLGNAHRAAGRPDLAAGRYTEALRLLPDYAEAYYNLAQTFVDRRQYERAAESFEQALQHKPGWPLAHRALANLSLGRGRPAEAILHFEQALETAPEDPALLNDLGVALEAAGRTVEARARYEAALAAAPAFFRPHVNLGNLAFAQGDDPGAREHYEEALRLAPGIGEPTAALARFLATCPEAELRDGERAVALAERAVDVSAQATARDLDTLAAAYASAGRFADAVATAHRAQKLADGDLAAAIAARLALYAQSRPFLVQRDKLASDE